MCRENVYTHTCWKVQHMFCIIIGKYKSLTTTTIKTIRREVIQAYFARVRLKT